MVEMQITVKGYFALAQDYEDEAAQRTNQGYVGTDGVELEIRACKAAAMRCRNSAYKLLGAPTMTADQRHMGEVMADF